MSNDNEFSLEKIEEQTGKDIRELIGKMVNKEIDCHRFLEVINYNYVGQGIAVMNELCKYPQSDECIICFKYIYCEYKANGTLKSEFYAKDIKFINMDYIKTKIKQMITADKPRLDLISILYYAKKDRDGHAKEYFTHEQLQYAADNGDSYAAYLIARKLENKLGLCGWERPKNITNNPDYSQMLKYYQLACDKGKRLALKNLAEIYHNEDNNENMEKIKELYLKCEGFDNIVFDDEGGCHINHSLLHSLILHLDQQVKEKDALITELLYEPGGRMYQETKKHFEGLAN